MPQLYVFSGLPGTGKSTLATRLARRVGGVYIRVDSVEAALVNQGFEVSIQGYAAAYAVAEDNLKLGNNVVADLVNPILATRQAWRDMALRTGGVLHNIEIICSDAAEHRRRVEMRREDYTASASAAWLPPTWEQVLVSMQTYEDWPGSASCVQLDTAFLSPEEAWTALQEDTQCS